MRDEFDGVEVEEEGRKPWRGWHVIARFLPMIFLGIIMIIIGLSPAAPHRGAESYGFIIVWVGAILIGAAFIGTLFTKCPVCYQTHWVRCVQEPDVILNRRHSSYDRKLSVPEEES